jgi:hypothetical protein
MLTMKRGLRFALLLPAAVLIGCAVNNPGSTTSSIQSGQPTNWEVQWTNSFPPLAIAATGELQINSSQATGTFTSIALPCIPSATENFTGTIDASGNLTLDARFITLQLLDVASGNTVLSGTLTGGGYLCQAGMSGPIVATEIAPLNGPYTGTLTASTESDSGQATLSVTQSTTPNADGSFSLTGTLTFPASSGFGTQPLSGRISGEGITLYDPTPGIVPVVSLTASTNPAATQITVSDLAFAVTASDIVTFTGTLTRQ